MTNQQEQTLTKRIKEEMTRVRNDAIVTGMKSAMSIILTMCNNSEDFPEDKVRKIQEFCERGLYNGTDRK